MFACWAINSLIATTSSQTHRVQTSPFVVYFPIKSVKCLQTLTMPLEAIMEIKVQVIFLVTGTFSSKKTQKTVK